MSKLWLPCQFALVPQPASSARATGHRPPSATIGRAPWYLDRHFILRGWRLPAVSLASRVAATIFRRQNGGRARAGGVNVSRLVDNGTRIAGPTCLARPKSLIKLTN